MKRKCKKPRNYERGGPVRGPGTATSDSILARISNGEYVLPAKAVPMIGLQNLERARAIANFVGGARSPSDMEGEGLRKMAGQFVDASTQAQAPTRMTPAGFGLRALVESPSAYAQTLDSPEARQLMQQNDAYRLMRGYAMGGLVDDPTQPSPGIGAPTGGLYAYDSATNSYASKNPGTGNDLSLANSMNAAADRMKAMREGPATTPAPTNPSQQNPMAGLASLFNPAQQSMDAYKTARSGADRLDVASGRFDREYVPRFAGGGTVGQEWERLPRFKDGWFSYSGIPIDPNQQRQLQEEAANAGRNRINQMSAGNVPIESSYYGVGATPRPNIQPSPPKMAAPSQPASVAATPGNEWGSLQDKWGIERPQPGTLPAMPGESMQLMPSEAQEASRRMNLRQMNAGFDRIALTASGATQLPGADIYRTTTPAPGFGPDNPNRVPGPGQVAGATTYAVPGLSAIGGGAAGHATFQGLPKPGGFLGYAGTPETAGMTQEQATAYNVANLNRQYEALRGLSQARAGDGQQGGYGGLDAQDLMRMSNPFYAPGQSYGDEILNRDRFMRQFPTTTGKGRLALANVEHALAQAQAARMQGLAQLMPKDGAQPGISPYQMGQLTNDRERLALDQARYRSDAEQKAMDRQSAAEQKAADYAAKLPKMQLQQKTNQLLAAYEQAVNSGNKDESAKLERLIQIFTRYNVPEDLASLMQQKSP